MLKRLRRTVSSNINNTNNFCISTLHINQYELDTSFVVCAFGSDSAEILSKYPQRLTN